MSSEEDDEDALNSDWLISIWIVAFTGPIFGLIIIVIMIDVLRHRKSIPLLVTVTTTIMCISFALNCFIYGIFRHTLYIDITSQISCNILHVGGYGMYIFGKILMGAVFVLRLHYTFNNNPILAYSIPKLMIIFFAFVGLIAITMLVFYIYIFWNHAHLLYINHKHNSRIANNIWNNNLIYVCAIPLNKFENKTDVLYPFVAMHILADFITQITVLFLFRKPFKQVKFVYHFIITDYNHI